MEVMGYLSFEQSMADANESTRINLAAEHIEIPEPLALLRKLRLYGSNGAFPFLESGGYMEQPYLTSLFIECCLRAEQKYRYIIGVQSGAIGKAAGTTSDYTE